MTNSERSMDRAETELAESKASPITDSRFFESWETGHFELRATRGLNIQGLIFSVPLLAIGAFFALEAVRTTLVFPGALALVMFAGGVVLLEGARPSNTYVELNALELHVTYVPTHFLERSFSMARRDIMRFETRWVGSKQPSTQLFVVTANGSRHVHMPGATMRAPNCNAEVARRLNYAMTVLHGDGPYRSR